MRTLLLAVVLAMLLAACTGAVTPTSVGPTPTTQPAPTSTTESTSSPTAPPSTTTTHSIDDPTTPPAGSFRPLPVPDETVPFTIGGVVLGDAGLVYAGAISPTPRDHPNEDALWHFDGTTWTRTLVADVTRGDQPWVSNLEYWGGRYLAFVQGDESSASMLTSVDGRTWQLEHLLPSRSAAGSLAGVFATPESPPWPGAAGVSGVTTTSDEIIAAGWVTTSEGSTGAIWRSADGRIWDMTPIPNAVWPNEWAGVVSVGRAGWLVAGSGPVHGHTLLWYSPNGEDWTYIGDQFGEDMWWSFGQLASGSGGLVIAATDMNDGFTSMWRSDDGFTWTQIDEPATDAQIVLVSDGSAMTKLRSDRGTTAVEVSSDGSTWVPVTTLPPGGDDAFSTWFDLDALGDATTVTRFMTPGDYLSASVELWIDAPTAGVVLVEPDDVLNVRDGVLASIIGELDPTAAGIQTTGRTDGAAGSLWMEVLHDGVPGWVNSLYLTETIDEVDPTEAVAAVEGFAEAVFRAGWPLGSTVGRKGLTIVHFDQPKLFTSDDDPMNDPTVYLWGSSGCGDDPDCAYQATFAEQIAAEFVGAWDDDDRIVEIDTPLGGGNATLPDAVIPIPFRNFHYVAVYDPGDDPAYAGLDWITWYVFLDWIDGEWKVAGLSVDTWAP